MAIVVIGFQALGADTIDTLISSSIAKSHVPKPMEEYRCREEGILDRPDFVLTDSAL